MLSPQGFYMENSAEITGYMRTGTLTNHQHNQQFLSRSHPRNKTKFLSQTGRHLHTPSSQRKRHTDGPPALPVHTPNTPGKAV